MTRCFFPLVLVLAQSYEEMWTQSELKFCGWRIRTPALVRSARGIHVLGRCCGKNLCSSKPDACVGQPPNRHCKNDTARPMLGDDNSDARTVMKTSWDGGLTWDDSTFQVIGPSHGPGALGIACSHGLYDRVRGRLVVQYHHFGTNTTRPATNVTTVQITSVDDGRTWSAPRDISTMVRACSTSTSMMYLSAGSKIQTERGRMLWPAHAWGGAACVWYTDDGGQTYNTSNVFVGNEVSVAAVGHNGTVLMDGRGTQYPWGKQHRRTRYWSRDDGATWGAGEESPLSSDGGSGCERALINVGGTLYTAEPALPDRSRMVLQCSTDGGASFPFSRVVNHNHSAAYSALLGPVPDPQKHNRTGLLMAWENDDNGNMYAAIIGTDWCGGGE
eukprot:g2274.t1